MTPIPHHNHLTPEIVSNLRLLSHPPTQPFARCPLGIATQLGSMSLPISDFIAELETTQEFRLLRALVLQPDVSPESALQKVLKLTASHIGNEKSLGQHCYDMACSHVELAARSLPDQQTKLVELFNLLQDTMVTDPTTGEPLKYDGDVVWKETPTFGYTFADELGTYSKPLHCGTDSSLLTLSCRSVGLQIYRRRTATLGNDDSFLCAAYCRLRQV